MDPWTPNNIEIRSKRKTAVEQGGVPKLRPQPTEAGAIIESDARHTACK